MTMVQWKSGCDYYLLSYEHFYLPNLPSKMGLKKLFLTQHLECRCGPTATFYLLNTTNPGSTRASLENCRLNTSWVGFNPDGIRVRPELVCAW